MTQTTKIDYEALTQQAMRGVIKSVLTQIASDGLPGDHHFYISFDTTADDVDVSKRLKGKYPQEMTIVLQHRFWDLAVFDDRFEVKLTFDGIPERLVVPYAAIKVFFDPSVRYGLQFEDPGFGADAMDSEAPQDADNTADAHDSVKSMPVALKPIVEHRDIPPPNGKPDGKEKRQTADATADDGDGERESASAEIVSLDAFRKK